MAKGRRLRKSGSGLLEIDKENVVVSDQEVVEGNVVASNQSIGEENAALLDLKLEEQNFVSSKIKIQNLCIKQFMWIRVDKDYRF
jgi:hypothetical protein